MLYEACSEILQLSLIRIFEIFQFRFLGSLAWETTHDKTFISAGQHNIYIPMPKAGYELGIPVFDWSNFVCSLDRTVTIIGY